MFIYNRSLLVSVYYIVYCLFQMSSKWFAWFIDGTSRHICNLASSAWVIYAPLGQLVASGGAFLGPATNNMAEYSAFIELLLDSMLRGITFLEVRIDS